MSGTHYECHRLGAQVTNLEFGDVTCPTLSSPRTWLSGPLHVNMEFGAFRPSHVKFPYADIVGLTRSNKGMSRQGQDFNRKGSEEDRNSSEAPSNFCPTPQACSRKILEVYCLVRSMPRIKTDLTSAFLIAKDQGTKTAKDNQSWWNLLKNGWKIMTPGFSVRQRNSTETSRRTETWHCMASRWQHLQKAVSSGSIPRPFGGNSHYLPAKQQESVFKRKAGRLCVQMRQDRSCACRAHWRFRRMRSGRNTVWFASRAVACKWM